MTDDQWFREAVVYQIYPRSFQDSDGDGIGDVPGIISRLDYLQQLGVDVVWLSPIYTSPQDDNGYDIADYQDIDPTFGTLADVDELIAQAHARGIRIVMDLVVNHTSDEHPWFVESRSSKDNPKRDWYWWRTARDGHTAGEEGAEPTNWESFFSGPAWELDEATGEYYLHLFSRKQPDLNWENPEVREAVYAMMRWWLDRGIDGFRMDVINMISKVTSLPDGEPLAATPQLGDGTPHFLNGPRIHEFLQEMHAAVFEGRAEKLLTVGEMPGVTVEDAILYTDPERREVDMVFQFEHVGLDIGAHKWDRSRVDLRDLKASLGRWQDALAEVGWNSLYWNNHDQPRAVSRFGSDAPEHRVASAKLLGTVLHLHRGHALRLPGRGARHDERAVRYRRRLPRHRVGQLLPARVAARAATSRASWPTCGSAAATTPAPPCSGTTARTRGSRPGSPGPRTNPNYHGDQRCGRGGRRRLGVPPLPPGHRAAPHRAGHRARRLPPAGARPPDALRVHPVARGRRPAGPRQLLGRTTSTSPAPASRARSISTGSESATLLARQPRRPHRRPPPPPPLGSPHPQALTYAASWPEALTALRRLVGDEARSGHSAVRRSRLCHYRGVIRAELGLGILGTALWIYCLFDVIMTDESRIRNLPKVTWIFVVLVTSVVGAVAWLVAGRPQDAAAGPAVQGQHRRGVPGVRAAGAVRRRRTRTTTRSSCGRCASGPRRRPRRRSGSGWSGSGSRPSRSSASGSIVGSGALTLRPKPGPTGSVQSRPPVQTPTATPEPTAEPDQRLQFVCSVRRPGWRRGGLARTLASMPSGLIRIS